MFASRSTSTSTLILYRSLTRSLSLSHSASTLSEVIRVSDSVNKGLLSNFPCGRVDSSDYLIGLSELRDESTDGLGLKEHPGADADAFDLTVMEPSPEGRTGDPQGSQGLLYGEQPL